jgi:N-acetylmuramoyl-L-alanine amidase
MAALSHSPHSHPHSEVRTGQVLQTVITVAIFLATLSIAFSPSMFSNANFNTLLAQFTTPQPVAIAPAATAEQIRIGIVSGHWGHDSGAVCDNGTTEQQVNLSIATLVEQKLTALGYQVDLLQEFDPRLNGYQAAVLLSIHNDSCQFINDQATGFKVASALASRDPNSSNRLVACIQDRYARITGLTFHDSVTSDMTQYHAFNEIDPGTTAAIIEAGFLYKDYNLLTTHQDLVADGIVAGIQCFVNNENIPLQPTLSP